MRKTSAVGVVVLAVCLAGCPGGGGGTGIQVPAPTQPRLDAVRIVGNRICAPLTAGGQTFTFNCLPLPTIESSGWQLTPAWTQSVADPQRQHSNKTVVLTVSAPTLTEIDVELVRAGPGANLPLTQVDANLPGNPGEVGAKRQVGVSVSDDGTRKTWRIEVLVSMCADFRSLYVFNRSSSSPGRSNPLSVSLVRADDETRCAGGVGPILGQVGGSKGSGPGDPVNPKPTGSCPGGASEQLFQVCENCASLHPPQLDNYSAGTYCSWQDVLSVYGYSGPTTVKPQTCTLRQVASREACEGAP